MLVRVLVVLVPLGVSVGVALLLIAALPEATTRPGEVAWWIVVLGGALGAALLTDRLARRALPLSVLLELSLVFPDRAPSRMKTLRSASVRELETQLLALRKAGESGTAIEVAETLVVLVGILGLHDKRTRGHSERVRAYVDLLSDQLGLPEEDRLRLRWAALIHDLGKLTVPGRILNGGKDLTDSDWDLLYQHPDEGERLAAGLLPWLGQWGAAVREHHERYDGSGYPQGLVGEQISLGARIVSVADAYEVMTSPRTYSRARSTAAARQELTACAGSQFDPAVVRAFLEIGLLRLRWVVGPLSWVVALPFAATADRAGQAIKASAAVAAVIGLVSGGVVGGPAVATPTGAVAGPSGPVTVVDVPAPAPSADLFGGTIAVPPAPTAKPVPGPSPTVPNPAPVAPAAPRPSPRPEASASPPVTPAATAEPSTAPTPTPSETPSATPNPTASASPSPPSVTPSPTSSPSPSPTAGPVAPSTASYYLRSAGGLTPGAPSGSSGGTVILTAGAAAASFDLPVPQGVVLSGTPIATVFVDVRKERGGGDGQGRLTLTLLDCTTSAGPCTTLATMTTAARGVEQVTGTFPAVTAALAPGHLLRFTVGLDSQGNAASAIVSFDAAATPSRLDLTAAPPP